MAAFDSPMTACSSTSLSQVDDSLRAPDTTQSSPQVSRPGSFKSASSQTSSKKNYVYLAKPAQAYYGSEKTTSLHLSSATGSSNASSASSTYSDTRSDTSLISSHAFGDPAAFTPRIQNQLRKAHRKAKYLNRPKWLSVILQYASYTLLIAVIYFFLVGFPLWHGAIYSFWRSYNTIHVKAGSVIFIGTAFSYAVMPLLTLFQKPREITEKSSQQNLQRASETALIIACYKSAGCIAHTLTCALKTFPAENIFVIANGNSETPLDNTGDICLEYGVNHIWVPMGSKIAAQYVGVAAAYRFKYCLMIDDDVALPDDFPIVTDRIQCNDEGQTGGNGRIKCIGYALEATDENGDAGNYCQQAQNLEYKLAGLSKQFFGKYGSASFPHGAISLWERTFLEECFRRHPGFRISEDWFFGVVCREAGGRIDFCSEVFVKTEVPKKLLRSGKGARAGYGELTVTAQRLWRWNFFLMARIFYNAHYILFCWRLRQYELLTKIEMFQELYGSLLMLVVPFVVPVAVFAAPEFYIPLTVGVMLMYLCVVICFVEIHLRLRGIKLNRKASYLYYPVYKFWLECVNVASW